jgi:hypothetical protein
LDGPSSPNANKSIRFSNRSPTGGSSPQKKPSIKAPVKAHKKIVQEQDDEIYEGGEDEEIKA